MKTPIVIMTFSHRTVFPAKLIHWNGFDRGSQRTKYGEISNAYKISYVIFNIKPLHKIVLLIIC